MAGQEWKGPERNGKDWIGMAGMENAHTQQTEMAPDEYEHFTEWVIAARKEADELFQKWNNVKIVFTEKDEGIKDGSREDKTETS